MSAAKRVVRKFLRHGERPAAKGEKNHEAAERGQEIKRKKKKWGVTDPAEISPQYYHHDLFKANFPLVNIVRVPAGVASPSPVGDKFDGHALEEKLMAAASRVWRKRAVQVWRRFKEPLSERQQAFPFHLALIEELKQFTLPSPRDLQRLGECNSRKRKLELSGEENPRDCEEQYAGFDIKAMCGDDMLVLDGSLSKKNKGLEIVPEATPTMEDDDLQEHEDISALFVHDSRALNKRRKTEDFVPDSERVCGILERKLAEDRSKERARWQGGFYGCKYAMVNLSKGHGNPLYVLAMTSSSWSYAQLVPEGYVQVRDGKLDPRSWKSFQEHQELSGKNGYKDLESLDLKLAQGTEFYRRSFRDNRQAVYRDGAMLVGTYYVRDDWYALPRTTSHGFNHAGAHRLLAGLLRLVLGDCAMTMEVGELLRRIELNEAIGEELTDDVY